MTLFLFLLIGMGTWWWIAQWVDSPATPAWKARDAYKTLTFCLMILLVFLMVKAWGWYVELTQLVKVCQ